MAVQHAVDHITDGAADNHRRAGFSPRAEIVFHNRARQIKADHSGQRQKEIFLPAAGIGQKAEGCAGVIHQR